MSGPDNHSANTLSMISRQDSGTAKGRQPGLYPALPPTSLLARAPAEGNLTGQSTFAAWEAQLLQKALQPLALQGRQPMPIPRSDRLREAYRVCAAITRQNSSTFYLTSRLLPKEARRAARALYAFCRISDDIIDRAGTDRLQKLDDWRRRSLVSGPNRGEMVPLAWSHARSTFGIPRRYAEQLLDGVAMDLTKIRYDDFTELAHYCYSVASTVGLMAMHIIGFDSEQAVPYAIKLGIALQLTNILRDVGEDWKNGRLYLPQDELQAFGVGEKDIQAGRVDDRWRAFMHFQIDRVRTLFAESRPGIKMLDRRGRFAIAASAELYGAILNRIEANDYDVFNQRAYVSGSRKLLRLPGIWWRTHMSRRTGI